MGASAWFYVYMLGTSVVEKKAIAARPVGRC